jgi:hypothetical protein
MVASGTQDATSAWSGQARAAVGAKERAIRFPLRRTVAKRQDWAGASGQHSRLSDDELDSVVLHLGSRHQGNLDAGSDVGRGLRADA